MLLKRAKQNTFSETGVCNGIHKITSSTSAGNVYLFYVKFREFPLRTEIISAKLLSYAWVSCSGAIEQFEDNPSWFLGCTSHANETWAYLQKILVSFRSSGKQGQIQNWSEQDLEMKKSSVNPFRRKCLTCVPIYYDQHISLDTIKEGSSYQLFILLFHFIEYYLGKLFWYYCNTVWFLCHYTFSWKSILEKGISHQKLVTWANMHNGIVWRYKGPQHRKESSHQWYCNYREGYKAPQVLTKRGLDIPW